MGPTRFDPRGVTLRRAGHHGQARNNVSSSPLWVLPISASRLMPSGYFTCMAPSSTEDARLEVWMQMLACQNKVRRASLGEVCGPNGRQADGGGAAQRRFGGGAGGRWGSGVVGRWGGGAEGRRATRAKRYVQCGLGDRRAQSSGNPCIC